MSEKIYVPGQGPINARIAIVGEAPSYEETKARQPLVGPSGKFLNSILSDVGINRHECWVTNVCKYELPPMPKGKRIPLSVRAQLIGVDIKQQIDELRAELQQIQPNVIIALGGSALWGLTGKNKIQNWRGSILLGMGMKVIGTYHPAHILRQEGEVKGYWNKYVMLADLKRAKEQSYFREIRRPFRNLKVVKSSAEFYDFIQRYKNHKNPAIDIEAIKCVPACIGIAFTPDEGITIPLWNTHGISEIHDNDLCNLWNMLSNFLSNHSVDGQNFGYDRDKIKRLGFTIGDLNSDTMLKAFCIDPELPKNLAFLTSILTEEPFYKDDGMYEGEVHDLLIGCARDACVTKEISNKQDNLLEQMNLVPYYKNFIHKLHGIYFYQDDDSSIEQIGLRIDENIRQQLLRRYIEWDERLRYQLYSIADDYINTGSPKQVASLIYGTWKVPQREGTGEEVLTQLLNGAVKNEMHRKGIELILEDRRVKKTINTYLYSPADYDGRMRASYFICLETGRSSTGQQDAPIRPTIEYRDKEDGKNVKKKQSRGMAFQTITKHGDIGNDIRKMFIPDEGEIFLSADMAQAEARVIFLLARDYLALEQIDTHDYHALTASWFFGGTEDDYSKKILGYESPIRFAGKTLRHACHLGASKKRAATEVNTQARKYKIDYRITEYEAGKAIEIFHRRQPSIQKVYHAEVQHQLAKDRILIAPVPYGIDAPLGGTRKFYERWGDELFRQAYSYLPQRTVSEAVKSAMLRIKARARWIKILIEAHDGILTSMPIDRKIEAAKIIKEEFERPIDFSKCSLPREQLIIPCDVEEGMNYMELKKFKWDDIVFGK